jgi:hypothetical protein
MVEMKNLNSASELFPLMGNTVLLSHFRDGGYPEKKIPAGGTV